jgi:corrinoid protein of di/trimethylamine methyltransferase
MNRLLYEGELSMAHEILDQLTSAVIEGEPEQAAGLAQKALEAGFEPLAIIDEALIPGMRTVGEKFECGDYFLPNLIFSANSMQEAMKVLEPELRKRQQERHSSGKVVIGTVTGDIHEIGKSLVGTMLSANGFEVFDLGVDVPIETFVAKVRETGANLVGLSALLTTTMSAQAEIIQALQAAGLRGQVKVMVGGAPVTRSWAEEIGADGYAEDAIGAVGEAKKLMGVS